jgi:hypothetical protein
VERARILKKFDVLKTDLTGDLFPPDEQPQTQQPARRKAPPAKTTTAPELSAADSARMVQPLLTQLELIDCAYTALRTSADEPVVRLYLQRIRDSVALMLAGKNVFEFEITPRAPLDNLLRERILVKTHVAGNGQEIVLQTLVAGIEMDFPHRPSLCLRRAEVITGCATA